MRNLAFHQNFSLNCDRLASLVRCILDSQTITKKTASVGMGVGEAAAEGTLGWLVKSGLGISQEDGYALSPFGKLVAVHDPELNHPGTLWLLHYHLTSEHTEKAEVLYRGFDEFLALANRDSLVTLIRCILNRQTITKKTASKCMGVGEPAVKENLSWFLNSGLGTLQKNRYVLSPFGEHVAVHDPELNHPDTFRLLRDNLIREHTERAEVWYRAFNEFLTPGVRFDRAALQVYVERTLEVTPKNQASIIEDCRKLRNCYTAPIALGKLELVREVEKDLYEAGLVRLPEPAIFAYVLFDAWQRRFPHTDTLRVTQICQEPELPGKVFAARREQVVQALQTLQSMGLVNIVDSQHEPVTRRFRDAPHQLLTTFYAAL